MSPVEAGALLARLTMTGLRSHETHNGLAWVATLRLDGKPVLAIEQAGNGGGNRYSPVGAADFRAARAVEAQLVEAARLLTGAKFEPLDTLTCCMVPGKTGMDAVKVAVSYSTPCSGEIESEGL